MGVRPFSRFSRKPALFCRSPERSRGGEPKGGPAELPTPNIAMPEADPASFITFFLYRPHRHRIAIRAIIHRQYSIENSARLQRRTHHPPVKPSSAAL